MPLSAQIVAQHPNESLSYVINVIQQTFPEFSIERKKDSWVCKAIAFLIWVFNPNFMERGTFAFRKKVYVTGAVEDALSRSTGRSAYCSSLVHEFVHMLDQERDGQFLFSMAYLFPQNLALLAFLALGALWWWPAIFFLAFLGAAAPWPAPYRLAYEVRGYAVGYALNSKMYPQLDILFWDEALEALQSPAYYYMTRKREAHNMNSLVYTQGGPFLYDGIEQIFTGLENQGVIRGD